VLPSAVPGILAGVILAVGRIVGETAALIYTSGTVAQVPENVYESARTLSVHMYALSSEGLHIGEGYATAAVLLVVVILINTCSAWIARRIGR
jgi:phosphate transport system permease protein